MANDLVERLPVNLIYWRDKDRHDVIKALEAADDMASKAWDIIVAQGWRGSDFHFKVHTYRTATQKENGDG